jgi:WD40 repeat protein
VLKHKTDGKTWQTGMVFSPDGKRLASAMRDGSICLWDMDATTPALLVRFQRFDGILTALAFSPDGKYFAAGARQLGSPVCVWDLSDAARPKEVYALTPKDQDEISALVFAPNSKTLFIGTGTKNVGGRVYSWKFRAESDAAVLWSRPKRFWVRSLDVTRDGARLGLTCDDQAYIVDCASGKTLFTLSHVPSHGVLGIAFSADGKRCVTAGYDKTVRLWSTSDGKQIWQNVQTTGLNEGVGISPDGRLAFTSSHWVENPQGNVAQLWRLPEP